MESSEGLSSAARCALLALPGKTATAFMIAAPSLPWLRRRRRAQPRGDGKHRLFYPCILERRKESPDRRARMKYDFVDIGGGNAGLGARSRIPAYWHLVAT